MSLTIVISRFKFHCIIVQTWGFQVSVSLMLDCPTIIFVQRPAGMWLRSSVCFPSSSRNNWRGTGERLSLPWHTGRVCGWLPSADEGSRPECGKLKLLSSSLSWWLSSHPAGQECMHASWPLVWNSISDFSLPRHGFQTVSDFCTNIIVMLRLCTVDRCMKNNLQAKFVEKL